MCETKFSGTSPYFSKLLKIPLSDLKSGIPLSVETPAPPKNTILFSANSCEEGLGDLKGTKKLFADYGKISNNAVWRFRKQGDVFAKLGTGSKKLNDYFTDKKIDFEQRNQIPVLAIENKILIVAREDISECVKIDGETEQIVKIEFLR